MKEDEYVVFGGAVALIALIYGMSWLFGQIMPLPDPEYAKLSGGVTLHATWPPKSESCWIENGNGDSVCVRHVWMFRGETTLGYLTLAPTQRVYLDQVSHQDGFYIESMDGRRLGWMSGDRDG